MTIFPSYRPAPPAQIAGNLLPEQAPTDRWWPDTAGVANAPLSDASAYKVFSMLAPHRQEMVDNTPGIARSFAIRKRAGAAPTLRAGRH
jgi:hypothetical protein